MLPQSWSGFAMTDLILALDVTEKKSALSIAHECAPHLDAIKVGYPLILSAGSLLPQELEAEDLPLIADFKVADIPNTNRLIAEQVFDARLLIHYLPWVYRKRCSPGMRRRRV